MKIAASTLHNKIFISADFEPKIGCQLENMANFFVTLWSNSVLFMCQKLELKKQIHLCKKGFAIFSKGLRFELLS